MENTMSLTYVAKELGDMGLKVNYKDKVVMIHKKGNSDRLGKTIKITKEEDEPPYFKVACFVNDTEYVFRDRENGAEAVTTAYEMHHMEVGNATVIFMTGDTHSVSIFKLECSERRFCYSKRISAPIEQAAALIMARLGDEMIDVVASATAFRQLAEKLPRAEMNYVFRVDPTTFEVQEAINWI